MLQESWKFTVSDPVTSYLEIQTKKLIGDDDQRYMHKDVHYSIIYDRKKKEDLIDLNIWEEGNGLVIVPQ